MFVQKSGRVDDWTCLKSSCQKLLLLFNCGFDSTLHWIKQIRYCFSENARPSLKILWPTLTQLWVSQWKTHKCRKNYQNNHRSDFSANNLSNGCTNCCRYFWEFFQQKTVFYDCFPKHTPLCRYEVQCVATLHSEKQKVGLNLVTKRAPIRADHHPVMGRYSPRVY